MKRLIVLLVTICFLPRSYSQEDYEYVNQIAPYPVFNVFNATGRTQITYTNGDLKNPEYFIITCDESRQEMDVRYYISREGFQITNANFFTIQRYPRGWLRMTPPYHAPSVVLYNSGMAGEGIHLIDALKGLSDPSEWGIVITFETYVNDHDIVTETWSNIIPSRIFKRDFEHTNLSVCETTKFNSILPLIGHSDENQ